MNEQILAILVTAIIVCSITAMLTDTISDGYLLDQCQHAGKIKLSTKWCECKVLP